MVSLSELKLNLFYNVRIILHTKLNEFREEGSQVMWKYIYIKQNTYI